MTIENIWIQKFGQWKSIVKKGCNAGAGPGGIFCTWIGRNCNYNDCPRRALEEIYVKAPGTDAQEKIIDELRKQVTALEEQLKLRPPAPEASPQEETDENLMDELRKIENA